MGQRPGEEAGTAIRHSNPDEVFRLPIPRLFAQERLTQLPLISVGHEHRLADPESLAKMLEAVEMAGEESPGARRTVTTSVGREVGVVGA